MRLRLLALVVFVVSLTGCFDMTETFNLKEDGSGMYEMKMDMSRMMGMFAMMKQGAGNPSGKPSEKIDSTIYYSSIIDTVSTLTAEEKLAFKDAYAKIHVDEDEAEVFAHMFFPFKDAKQLALIQKVLGSKNGDPVLKAFSKALKSGAGGPAGMEGVDVGMGSEKGDKDGKDDKGGLPMSDFIYNLDGKSFSRKVDVAAAKPAKAKSKEEELPAQFKEMMKINYTTIVNLPRPATNVAGKGTLSADKKQVRFNKSMQLDDPQLPADFDFTIQY